MRPEGLVRAALLAAALAGWACQPALAQTTICAAASEENTMGYEIVTDIDIDAPPARVWQILLDFERYPDWNPFVREISGKAEVDARLSIRIQPEGKRGMSFRPTVLAATPERELRWLGHLWIPRLFDGEHFFRLEPRANGNLHFVHGECFRGVLVPLLWPWLEADTRQGFGRMNEALKQRAEGRVGAEFRSAETRTSASGG